MLSDAQATSAAAIVPVSSMYRRAWTALRDHGRWPSVRTCTSAVQVLGELNADLLRVCILEVVRRHEALRTRVVKYDDAPFLVVNPEADLHFEQIDVSREPDTRVRDALINEFCERQIDLLAEPPFAVGLFRLASNEYILVLALDHIIVDGRSLGILEQEIWSKYCSLMAGVTCPLPEISVQLTDYLRWCETNRSNWQHQHLPYWRNYLAGVSSLHVPRSEGSRHLVALDSGFENGQDGAVMVLPLREDVCELMRLYARRQRISLSMVALSVHALTMGGWCKANDFPMTFVSDGRYDWSLQNTIGFLSERLVLRIALREHESFTELVRRLKIDVHAAVGNGGGQYLSEVIPELGIEAIEAYFNWSQVDINQLEQVKRKTAGKLSLKYRVFRPAIPLGFLPIYLGMAEAIHLLVYHRPHVVSSDVVRSFVDNLNEVAERVISQPDLPIRNSLAAAHLDWTGGPRGR